MLAITTSKTSTALLTLAGRINEREETIDTFRSRVEDTLRLAAPEIILQGQDLIAAKAHLRHGDWQTWLGAHCPKVSARNARRYMARAADATLSDYYHLLCDQEEEPAAAGQDRQWLPYVEALGRVARFRAYLSRFPISNWPAPGRQKLKEELEPIARELWPDQFKA
jgi:hypothetical protein